MILIPFKNRAQAKQRLAAVLDEKQRAALSAALLEDVLATLAAWPRCPSVAVVTGDSWATDLARRFSFGVIHDHANRGETEAIEMATQAATASGAHWTLVLPGDIPLLGATEVEAMLAAAPPEGAVLVPAADGRGTNGALRRPAALFPLRFGDDSFWPHHVAAEATGKPCVILHLPGIGLDIDRPADLAEALARSGHTRTQALLRSWFVGEHVAVGQSR